MKLPFSEHKGGFRIYSEMWYEIFKKECGKGSKNKKIPKWILKHNRRKKCLDSIIWGDGHDRENDAIIGSVSEQLLDDIACLATSLGYVCTFWEDPTRRVRLSRKLQSTFGICKLEKIKSIRKIQQKIMVRNIEVDGEHTYVAKSKRGWFLTHNSIFGAFAQESFRMYDTRIAGSITKKGVKYIKDLIYYIENVLNYPVLYSDTDSVFIDIGGDGSFNNFKTKGEAAENTVNKYLLDMAEKEGLKEPPVIEFEVGFKKFLLGKKKKKYAGHITYYKGRPADEIMIKGFAARRSDAAGETQKLQIDVVDLILKGGTEKDIRARINLSIGRIRNEKIDVVGFPKKLNMELHDYANIQNYRHFLWAIRYLNKKYPPGSRPFVFWLGNQMPDGLPGAIELEVMLKRKGTRKGGEKSKTRKYYKIDRVPLDTDEELDKWRPFIDWRKQTYNMVDRKLGAFLDAVEITMSEIKSGQKQQRPF